MYVKSFLKLIFMCNLVVYVVKYVRNKLLNETKSIRDKICITWCVEKQVFAIVKTISARLMIGITIPSVFTPVSRFADHRIFFQGIVEIFEPSFTSCCSRSKFKKYQFCKMFFATYHTHYLLRINVFSAITLQEIEYLLDSMQYCPESPQIQALGLTYNNSFYS